MNQLSRRIQLALFISNLAAAQPFRTPAPLDPVFRGQAPCIDEIEGLEARAARHGQRASVMLAVRPTMLPGPWRASVADFEREARDLHALHNRLVGEYWTYARAVARYACQGSCAGRLHNVKAGMLPLVREQQRILHAGLARTHADLGNAFAQISRAAEGGLGQADLRPLYVRSGQRFIILTLAHKADFQNGVDRAERRAPA